MGNIGSNLIRIKENIHNLCSQFQRDPSFVDLVAVCKTYPSNVITEALKDGQFLFAENKVQEALKKREELGNIAYQMHLIGPLQSNKVHKAVEVFEMIHSIDRSEIAKKVSDSALESQKTMPILLQINTSFEEQKSGFNPDLSQILDFLEELKENHKGVIVRGLMTMGPMDMNEKITKQCFSDLFEMKEKINQGGKHCLKHLSMGMSNDYHWAIEYGSTLLRIGSAIFGERIYS